MEHRPVLLEETIDFLAPERGGLFVDCTVGLGGHAAAILERGDRSEVLGIDRDPAALERAAVRLAPHRGRFRLVEAEFGDLAVSLAGAGPLAGVFADLGVSSMQLDTAERGFSFRRDGPLDMRMGRGGLTARDIVNDYPEGELEKIFREYGEERRARRIARSIGRARETRPIETTGELQEIVARAQGALGRAKRPGEIDPATRVFQALRIEVNAELQQLERMLDEAVRLLEDDGRLVVISYHSLEDRIVKNRLRDLARGQIDPVTGQSLSETRVLEVLTKKPLRPSEEELASNPRSRSARLRAARRVEGA